MRITRIITTSLVAAIATLSANALVPRASPARNVSMLLNLPALSALPTPLQAARSILNLTNIQGDIAIGMTKKNERFIFFRINNPTLFKPALAGLIPTITTVIEMLDVTLQPLTMLNIAFSQAGLNALNIRDSLGDPVFAAGQAADATNIGDPGTTNWQSQFINQQIHGVFLLASDSSVLLDTEAAAISVAFGLSITQVLTLNGQVRPGAEAGHEHFGFMDGVSQPAINGFTIPSPGQAVIDPGKILVGETGDTNTARPSWAKDGSFLAFRQLKQFVPEFNKFLTDNPLSVAGVSLTPQQGSDLFGARIIGRWKSGAPVDIATRFDDPALANDKQRNNNFTYAHPGEDLTSDQTRCPFAAHTRKVAPRADLSPTDVDHHIMRSSIPFGPEVTSNEASTNTTSMERGLLFVGYQSDLSAGFQFIQKFWANNPNFIFGKTDPTPGFDVIIGQNGTQQRFVSGLDVDNPNRDVTLLTNFVQGRGGEYFFSPSILALVTKFVL